MNFTFPTERFIPWAQKLSRKTFKQKLTRRIAEETSSIALTKREDREAKRQIWKRDLSLRANGTIDPWVGISFEVGRYVQLMNVSSVWLLPVGYVHRLRSQLYVPME